MYQELTIDAAKKLYQILIVYYQTVVRAESTMHLSCGVNADVLFGDKKISEKDVLCGYSIFAKCNTEYRNFESWLKDKNLYDKVRLNKYLYLLALTLKYS